MRRKGVVAIIDGSNGAFFKELEEERVVVKATCTAFTKVIFCK